MITLLIVMGSILLYVIISFRIYGYLRYKTRLGREKKKRNLCGNQITAFERILDGVIDETEENSFGLFIFSVFWGFGIVPMGLLFLGAIIHNHLTKGTTLSERIENKISKVLGDNDSRTDKKGRLSISKEDKE